MNWCRTLVDGSGIEIKNFGPSFGNGLAFCAVVSALMPERLDLNECWGNDRATNYAVAFEAAAAAGQQPLLDVAECMQTPHPDPMACQTYLFELFRKFSRGGSLAHIVTGRLL
jgi:hypothetical protein